MDTLNDFIKSFTSLLIFLAIIPYAMYRFFTYIKIKWGFYIFIFLYIGFSLMISMIGFIPTGSENRAKISSTKGNMHKLESLLYEYNQEKNQYPKSIEELEDFLKSSQSINYPLLIKNPFNNKVGKGESFDNLKKLIKEKNKLFYGKSGVIYYNPIIQKNGTCIKYFIYGGGYKNELILNNNNGTPFTISNE